MCVCRALVEHNPGAVKLSTDDHFTRHGEYQFDPSALGEAHEWNQIRGKHTVLRSDAAVASQNFFADHCFPLSVVVFFNLSCTKTTYHIMCFLLCLSCANFIP